MCGPVGEALASRQEAQRADYGDVRLHLLADVVRGGYTEYGMWSRDVEKLLCIVAREGRLDVEA
jgi:hypothetical protein